MTIFAELIFLNTKLNGADILPHEIIKSIFWDE